MSRQTGKMDAINILGVGNNPASLDRAVAHWLAHLQIFWPTQSQIAQPHRTLIDEGNGINL